MKKITLLFALIAISISYSQTYKKGDFYNLYNISFSTPSNVYSTPRPEFGGSKRNISNEINDEYTLSAEYTKGIFLNETTSIGLGFGYTHFKFNWIDYTTTSDLDHADLFNVFVDVRKYFSDSINSPFVYLDYGKIVKLWSDFRYQSEFNRLFKIGIGYKFKPYKNLNIVSSLSVNHKKYTHDKTMNINGVTLNLGLIF